MTEQIADIATKALAPNFDITVDQLAALVMLLAVATALLAYGLGRHVAKLEKRLRDLEAQGGEENR